MSGMSGSAATITAGKTFEDFQPGDTLVSPGRTIEASDINAFAGLTGDFYPLHVDEEVARRTRFGGRIAHGPLTFSVAVGLVGLSGFYADAIEAMLGVDQVRALHPVRPGDTIRVHVVVSECSPAPSPRLGRMDVAYSVRNQNDEEVMTFVMLLLARRRAPLEGRDDG